MSGPPSTRVVVCIVPVACQYNMLHVYFKIITYDMMYRLAIDSMLFNIEQLPRQLLISIHVYYTRVLLSIPVPVCVHVALKCDKGKPEIPKFQNSGIPNPSFDHWQLFLSLILHSIFYIFYQLCKLSMRIKLFMKHLNQILNSYHFIGPRE